jgi:positive regulator of sigma E activity
MSNLKNISLAKNNPELSKQWHPTSNGCLTPEDVSKGSNKKVWWLCENGHTWEATISNRSHGRGCPYCSGKKVCNDNSLQSLNLKLSKQWHPTKNGKMTPNDVTLKSGKKVWWVCEQGHEWEAIIAERANGSGCPYCSGRRACTSNSLQSLYPELSRQWHPTKNRNLTPNDITVGSGKKVWWLCDKNHEWNAIIKSRIKGNGCPYCSGQRVCADNSLSTLYPDISKQWHCKKNRDLTPDDVTPYSNKKVWWCCKKNHEWEATVAERTIGRGCPYCSGRRVCNDNNLQTVNPELSKQWHTTKNGNLTPNDVTIGSDKSVWWQCNQGHEWEALIYSRSNGNGCPYCANKLVCSDNSLLFINPELSKQWHPTKNGNLTPNDVIAGSSKIVWWLCNKGHEWEAAIIKRNEGSGCPQCNKESKTSFPEQSIFFYFRKIFDDTINRYKFNGMYEIDIFVPSLNFGIEYDGFYYHKNKEVADARKDSFMLAEGINLIRVKETERRIKKINEKKVIYCDMNPSDLQHDEIVRLCLNYVSTNITQKLYDVEINVKKDRMYIYDSYIKSEEEKSLLALYPALSKQWHPTKNANIQPDMVKVKSGRKFWWICDKGHEWEAAISHRSNGTGCPYCAGQRVGPDNSLKSLNPSLAKQWNFSKNKELSPNDVTLGSKKRVWWICDKSHEWEASVYNRTKGRGCPYCAGRKVYNDNCLQTMNPELSKQWHPTKNNGLTPMDVTTGSNKIVWWICENGHEWEAMINNRSKSTGCPYCTG